MTDDSTATLLQRIMQSDRPEVHIFGEVASPTAPRRVLILDASYAPPTLAHEALVLEAVQQRGAHPYDVLYLLLATRNADKQSQGVLPFLHRIAMMRLVAGRLTTSTGLPAFVGILNVARFTDKARLLEQHFVAQGCVAVPELHFLVGADTFVRLFDGKYYLPAGESARGREAVVIAALAPLLARHYIVAADRASSPTIADLLGRGDAAVERYKDHILRVRTAAAVMDISSTRVRAWLTRPDRASTVPTDLVAPEVGSYLVENVRLPISPPTAAAAEK